MGVIRPESDVFSPELGVLRSFFMCKQGLIELEDYESEMTGGKSEMTNSTNRNVIRNDHHHHHHHHEPKT